MEADKARQVSALLACQSQADLRQLREMVSPFFPFITLACKHNRADLLHFLLEDDTSFPSDGAVVVSRWCSVEQKDEGHDAAYYAIRSSNVEVLRTLLGSVTPELSEQLVAESYQKLLLNNVLVSEEMHLFVEYTLLDLRFFSIDDGRLPATSVSISNIQERILLLVENIAQINTYEEVDSHFLYTAKFIAQNIYILKQQLKSTYNILPWEEIEFCLVCFVSAHIKRQELNIFYLSVLKKDKLLKELDKFASALQELEEHIRSTDIHTLRKPVKLNREDVADAIITKYPDLYGDYKEVRDVSSLHIMETYLEAALLADPATRPGQLTIKRALQVTGEHLKNTLDSPKLSPAVSDLLLLSAPKETRKVLKDLRNSISKVHLELEDSLLYFNIQNDIKKIASVITEITYFNKLDKIKCMLTTLINSDGLDEFEENANLLKNIHIIESARETHTVTKDHRIEDLIGKIENKTPYEEKLFADMKDVLDKMKLQHRLTHKEYLSLKALTNFTYFRAHVRGPKYICNMMRNTKCVAERILDSFPSQKNALELESFYMLGSLLSKFYKSVSKRINPENTLKIKLEISISNVSGSFDKGNIKSIDEYSRQILLDFNKNGYAEEKCTVKSVKNISEIIIGEQLTMKLNELRNTIGIDRMNGQLNEHLALLYKDKTTNRFTVEALVMDTMNLLDGSKSVINNVLYLDGDVPLLSGKCLRNHLAHGNALVDILPIDAWSAVLLNAAKLAESKDHLLNSKIGAISKHDINQLRRRYERGLSILNEQKEMWKSLLDGNFEKFTSEIAKGADICSRKIDLSSTLHYAAQGTNIETVKFLTKLKLIRTEAKDINGQTALHIAAKFGRDVTVKFLVTEMESAINEVDGAGKTPLHLASQNGHKKTVETLLSLGAKKTIKDISGFHPLHYAVMNNDLDLFDILLEKEENVDEILWTAQNNSFHIAAEFGFVEMVQHLLLNEADVNAKNDFGIFPMHLAVINGHREVLNILLEKGAHVNFRDCKGYSSLYFAVANDHEEIVKILLKKGAFVNNGDVTYNITPLHLAVSKGNAIIVNLLLQHNANVNAVRNDDLTPFLLAVAGGHADIIDLLLRNGALTDSRDVNGMTALHIAAQAGHTSVVETLIQRGIDIHSRDSYQETALHMAARAGHLRVVECLLTAGADVHFVNKEGSTALHLSAVNGHEVISEALIRNGAKVNCKNSDNITPLLLAATETGNEKSIQILLKCGADVNERCGLYRTALHIASLVGDGPMVEALLQGKSDVDAEDNCGLTALHLASSVNQKAAAEILLKHGADVNYLDTTGSSALCYSARNNNKDMLDMLIAKGADVNVGEGKLLLTAITAGHRHIFEALLKNKDLDINIKDQNGLNLLYTAAKNGDRLIAKALIKKGIKVADCLDNPTPLSIAASFGHTEMVDVLLENGADVNSVDPEFSPLYYAVLMNKPDILDKLLHRGANSCIRFSMNRMPLELTDTNTHLPNTLLMLQQRGVKINERSDDNWTLLHIAAQAGNLEVTKLLVDRGFDVNATDRLGLKPIHIAAKHGHHSILSFFLDFGMSIDDPGPDGCTLMHFAAAGGQLTVAQYLIDKRVDINSTDLNGFQPIHYSAELGHAEMVKLLLHSGAVYDSRDKFGKTPLDLTKSRDIKEVLESIEKLFDAVKRNDVSMVEILVKNHAKYLNVNCFDNATLLHVASQSGFSKVCDILLKSKANPNAVGKGGNVPLHYASEYCHTEIVKSLLKNGAAYNLKSDNMNAPSDLATQKDIKSLLQFVEQCFGGVRTRDVKVIENINKIRDLETVKAVMKARDTDGNSLVVVAMKNDFPDVVQLKQVSQANTSRTLFNIQSMLAHGRFPEALDILNQLLCDRIEILGEDNPGTLDIQYEIVLALLNQSTPQTISEGLPMLEDIYRKRVAVFGPHHPDSLETRSNPALLLHKLERNTEAWDIFQEVLPRQQEVLGEGHEQLMLTKSIAGVVLYNLGKYEEALNLSTEVYKIRKITFGSHHSSTIFEQYKIAAALWGQQKYHEAFALFQTVYELQKKSLGQDHAETLRTKCQLAVVLVSQQKLDEALEIIQETFAIQKIVLGLNHVDTVHTHDLMTRLYLRQNNSTDALKVHKAGLDARNTVYGPNHPQFIKLDGILNDIDKQIKIKWKKDVGYILPCDFNLLNAAYKGDKSEVCNLIENGSDVNTADGEGRTALHFAATVEVTEVLLDNGTDPIAVSQKGNTPLHLATLRSCRQTVILLLQNVKKTKPSAYRKFINAKTVVGGSTALHVAAKNGAADIVSCLLEHGACYNSRDRSDNRTPLQCSSSPSVTRLLHLAEKVFAMALRGGTVLPRGDKRHLVAVLNSRDTEHRTPLQVALVHGHNTTARLLAGLLKAQDYRSSNGRRSIDALD